MALTDEMLRLILEHGGDPNANGQQRARCAMEECDWRIMQILLANGLSVTPEMAAFARDHQHLGIGRIMCENEEIQRIEAQERRRAEQELERKIAHQLLRMGEGTPPPPQTRAPPKRCLSAVEDKCAQHQCLETANNAKRRRLNAELQCLNANPHEQIKSALVVGYRLYAQQRALV